MGKSSGTSSVDFAQVLGWIKDIILYKQEIIGAKVKVYPPCPPSVNVYYPNSAKQFHLMYFGYLWFVYEDGGEYWDGEPHRVTRPQMIIWPEGKRPCGIKWWARKGVHIEVAGMFTDFVDGGPGIKIGGEVANMILGKLPALGQL